MDATVLLTRAWLYFAAFWPVFCAVVAVVTTAWKAIPADRRAAIEKAFPRVGNLMRALCAVGPDLIKFALAVFKMLLGAQWRPPAATPAITPVTIVPDENASNR